MPRTGNYKGGISQRRLSFTQLERYLWGRGYRNTFEGGADKQYPDALSDGRVALLAGVSRHSVWRWRHHGGIPINTCDAIADHLGVTGLEIWDEYYEMEMVA